MDSKDPNRSPATRTRREDQPTRARRLDQRNPTPLITKRLESGAWARLPRIDAHCAYVLAYGGGELQAFTHTPRFADRAGSVRCYVVDTSPRLAHGTLKTNARGDRYSFDTTYDVQWRVADPIQVVRDNVHDGHATVARFLQGKLGPISRHFEPEDAEGVEMQIYAMLGAPSEEGGGLPVGNGLAVIALSVQVTPDPRVTGRGVALDDDVQEGTLIERRTSRLRHLLSGDGSEILYHLAQNPTDTNTVLQMITDAKDRSEPLRLEWLDRMRADDVIQEADYEFARSAVLGDGSVPSPVLDTSPFGSWSNLTPPIVDSNPSPPRQADNPFQPYDPASVAEPTTPTEPAPVIPPAPRDVRADRLASGSVLVWWGDVGDVEYRVRRLLDDGQWQVIATTTDTFIEDSEPPQGAVLIYSVSATTGGVRSSETRSGS